MDNVFLLIYIYEMMVRMYYHGIKYFKDPWNVFDFFLITITIIDLWIITPIYCGGQLKVFVVLR